LETIIDHLKLERLALFGISLSGPVAVIYAARHPERVSHLILYDTFARGEAMGTDEVKKAFVSLVRAHWGIGSKTLADLFFPGAGANPTMVEQFSKIQRACATPEMAAQLLDMVYQADIALLCANIQAPTLVLHRQHDHVVPFRLGRELASLIPNASFVPLEGDIHLPHFGDSMSVLRTIAEFLGDPVSDDSADGDSNVVPKSNLIEPKPEQQKKEWLRLDNPIIYILVTMVASVLAGIILMLIKC
jgi:pimeloyl-ACP methyl ester carboxylesterase